MTSPKISKIEIQGFRAFGWKGQTLAFGSLLATIWTPNSQGKTSLAEAFEFLLTGQIVRRQLMASTQDEFADALRNAHMPAGMPAYVKAEITDGADGEPHTVRRTLISDYAKRQDCQSIRHDESRYRDRWRIEAAFCRLKDFRRIATRYDKLAANFLSAVVLAAIVAFWV